jgi:hypothetical protein
MTDAHDIDATRRALIGLGLSPGATTLPLDGLTLTLVPRDSSLAPKEIPVEALLGKLTAMRDKLRVLEQRVNAADLGAAERAALQGHVTATAASFAAFAAFFSNEAVPPPVPTTAE